uniref:guanylate cyclase n=1 Tax=Heterorhabditis bacteriophora TaxID=37862 RepID=A0A1I7X0P2_HETBA
MHYFIDQIAFKSEMRGPTFQCETLGESGLRLHYFSHRQGLFPIVKGLVRRTARVLYEMDVKVNVVERSQERRKSGMVEHVVFSLEPDEDHKAGKRMAYKFKRESRVINELVALADGQHILPISIRDFLFIFPYHICFNKQMVVEHVGYHLLKEYGLGDKKMLKLTELVQLVQPADIQITYKNITTYLNTLFIFQLKHHCKRNEVDKGSSEAFQQPLSLKADELEKKKSQTEHLLYEFVPPVIADAFRQSKSVPAQEYSECTVMFTDIPDFFTINMNSKPHEVIELISDLFSRFDRAIEKHKVSLKLTIRIGMHCGHFYTFYMFILWNIDICIDFKRDSPLVNLFYRTKNEKLSIWEIVDREKVL